MELWWFWEFWELDRRKLQNRVEDVFDTFNNLNQGCTTGTTNNDRKEDYVAVTVGSRDVSVCSEVVSARRSNCNTGRQSRDG